MRSQRPLGLAQPRLGEIDVGDADGDLLPPRAVQGAQERGFGGVEVRLARVELALDRPAFDLDEMLAGLDTGAGADEQLGDRAGHRGSEREHVAAAFDPPRRGHRRYPPAGSRWPAGSRRRGPTMRATKFLRSARRAERPTGSPARARSLRVSRMTSLKAWSPHTQNASTSSPAAKSAAQKKVSGCIGFRREPGAEKTGYGQELPQCGRAGVRRRGPACRRSCTGTAARARRGPPSPS